MVPRVNWDTLDKFVLAGKLAQEYHHAKEHITNPNYLNALINPLQIAHSSVTPHQHPPEADITEQDHEQLLRDAYIRPLTPTEIPLAYVDLFTAKEKLRVDCDDNNPSLTQLLGAQMTRRRLITVPREMNDAPQQLEETALPTREEIINGLETEGAETHDVSAFFTHFPLPPQAQLFYCFVYKRKHYALLTIPTGGRHCPCLAQAVSKSISNEVMRLIPTVQILTYLDNFRFSGSREEVTIAVTEFKRLCVELSIQTECDNTFSAHYIFLGIRCHHKTAVAPASTSAALKSLSKLVRTFHEFTRTETPTYRTGLQLLGSLMWISPLTNINMHEFYIPLKFFRRKATTTGLEDVIRVWACALPALKKWVRMALQNTPRTYNFEIDAQASVITLYTDACMDGFGAVAFYTDDRNAQRVLITMGPWHQFWNGTQPHINQLEAAALIIGLEAVKDVQAERASIFVDNSTLVAILNRGYSPQWWANQAAALLRTTLDERYKVWQVSWIATFENISDLASRTQVEQWLSVETPLD